MAYDHHIEAAKRMMQIKSDRFDIRIRELAGLCFGMCYSYNNADDRDYLEKAGYMMAELYRITGNHTYMERMERLKKEDFKEEETQVMPDYPEELKKEVLEKRRIVVLLNYDILENEDGEILFSIRDLKSPVKKTYIPRLYYDYGKHALLLKNDEVVVVCDSVHPGVRNNLAKQDEVYICEVEDENDINEFMAEVVLWKDIEQLAEELMNMPVEETRPSLEELLERDEL
jgi:hydroxypyruvate isomerase